MRHLYQDIAHVTDDFLSRLSIRPTNEHTAVVSPYGFPMEVTFEYFDGEAPTQDHPGAPDDCQILSCRVGGIDINDMLSPVQTDRICEAITEQVQP